jgi:hypothetical protein
MLHAGLDLSRRKVDVCLLSTGGEPTRCGSLALRLGLCVPSWRVVAHFVRRPRDRIYPICRYFLRWRDPDSNRGHQDFQGVASG